MEVEVEIEVDVEFEVLEVEAELVEVVEEIVVEEVVEVLGGVLRRRPELYVPRGWPSREGRNLLFILGWQGYIWNNERNM